MPKIKPTKLPDGRILLMESDENVAIPDLSAYFEKSDQEGDSLRSKDWTESATEKLQNLIGTLESLAAYIPNAIKQASGASVDKLTLKFGVKLAGEAGLPYISKGSAEGNIEIVMECSFPDKLGT